MQCGAVNRPLHPALVGVSVDEYGVRRARRKPSETPVADSVVGDGDGQRRMARVDS
ncbi:MAG: hypothetical protein O2782_17740 [bacterium]|nr:hypothetical protein [bacterium]